MARNRRDGKRIIISFSTGRRMAGSPRDRPRSLFFAAKEGGMSAKEPEIHEDPLPGHESRLEPKPEWQPRYAGSDRLRGKVAVVTGADSGIGRAVAALFAREGADVAILYLCEHDDAEKTAGKIGRAHVCTPVTNAHLVCRLLLEKKNKQNTQHVRIDNLN